MALDQLIPGIIGLLVFGVPTAYLLRLWILSRSSRAWPTTPGTIIVSSVRPGTRRDRASFAVRYQYQVDGTQYTGSTVRFGDFINNNADDARAAARRYPLGATVSVRYHPRRPRLAVLERGTFGMLPVWVLIGLFMTSSILLGLFFE